MRGSFVLNYTDDVGLLKILIIFYIYITNYGLCVTHLFYNREIKLLWKILINVVLCGFLGNDWLDV